MPFSTPAKKVAIVFPSIGQLSSFKHACNCADFYVDRDALTLVGTFTEEQLQIANNQHSAMVQILPDNGQGL